MNRIATKGPRQRLDPKSYELVREQVLKRDGWRCQYCGITLNLEVHHKEFRSRGGNDSKENLITMCVSCHASCHSGQGHVRRAR